jgi:hypothetical protein
MTGPESISKRNAQQTKMWVQGLVFVGGLVVYLLLGLVLWWILDQYIQPQDSGEKKDLIQALGLIMAGLAGIVGIWFTWRNLSNAQEQLTSTHAQLQLAQEGQITDRFTKAIDHIGDTADGKKRLEVRIGGIYALQRIAHDSVQYYGPCLETLTSYIRENAPHSPKVASPLPSAERTESEANEWDEWADQNFPLSLMPYVSTDIQAILDVLRRRDESLVPSSYRVSLDLRRTDLRGTDLVGANLKGADLSGANLQDAWLLGANLEGADFSGANLQRAWLSQARLTKAALFDAHLEGACLWGGSIGNPTFQMARALLGREETGSLEFPAADLREAQGLVQEQLELTLGGADVNLPQDLQQPDLWGLQGQEQVDTIRERIREQVSRGVGD